jgi:hypothetical protein
MRSIAYFERLLRDQAYGRCSQATVRNARCIYSDNRAGAI